MTEITNTDVSTFIINLLLENSEKNALGRIMSMFFITGRQAGWSDRQLLDSFLDVYEGELPVGAKIPDPNLDPKE